MGKLLGIIHLLKIVACFYCLTLMTSALEHYAPGSERNRKVREVTTVPSIYTPKETYFPPDISEVELVITNEDVCTMKDGDVPIQVALFVVSHVGNLQRRKNIREAYPAEMIRPLGIRRVFVLASLENEIEPNKNYPSVKHEDIAEESKKFGDIVQFDSLESFDGLTFKSLLTFNYSSSVCSNARFVFKIDDDLLVNYFKLLEEMMSVKDKNVDDIHGKIWNNMQVIRRKNSKYYVSKYEWSSDLYSQYVSGVLYGTSPATARALVKKSAEVNFCKMEDFYMTGLLADAVGAKRSSIEKMLSSEGLSLNCCHDDEKNVVYLCEFVVALQYRGEDDLLARVKSHGEFCYENKTCLTLDDEAKKSKSLKCF